MRPFGALSAAALRTVQPAGSIHAGGAADHLAVLQAAGQGSRRTIGTQSLQQQSREQQTRQWQTTPQTTLQTTLQTTQQPTRPQTTPQTRPSDALQAAGQSAAPQQGAGLGVEGVLEHWANALFIARCNSLKNAGERDCGNLEWLKTSRAELKGKQKGELTSFSTAVRDDIKRMDKKKTSSENAGMSVQEVVRAFSAKDLTRDDKYCFGLWCLLALQQNPCRSDETQRRQLVTLLEMVHQSLIGDGDKFGCSPSLTILTGDFALAANHNYDPRRLKPTADWAVEQNKRNETCQSLKKKARTVIWAYNQANSCYELFGQFFKQQGIYELKFMSEHLRDMRGHIKTEVEKLIKLAEIQLNNAHLAEEITEDFEKSGKLDKALALDVLQRKFIDQMANVHASME